MSFGKVVLILLALIIINYVVAAIVGSPTNPNPQLISHRGGPDYHPENTMAAFQQAIQDGADRLEFDVQMTVDEVLVVIHDETVDRTTNKSGSVAEMTLAEIQALDAGDGQRVPTFEEVINLAKNAGVMIMPEAKSPLLYPGIEEAMLREISNANYQKNTIIQSFVEETLDNFGELDPNQPLCVLYGLGKLKVADPQPGNAKNACIMAEMVILNPWMIQSIHNKGYNAYVWFGALENPITAWLMLAFGADGLMLDDHRMLPNQFNR